MKTLLKLTLLTALWACVGYAHGQSTWFVRQYGGTLYNAGHTSGQCDGLADVDYPGTGTGQHCALSSVQYFYLDGTYGLSSYSVSGFSGGDTMVIRGCAALPNEVNSDAPHCRIGLVDPNNTYGLCHGVNTAWGCSMQ